jgi:hypothetical protein
VAEGIDVTRAEFDFAVIHEGVMTADDLLDVAPESDWSTPTVPAPRK